MNEHNPPLLFAQIGDLHLTDAREQNFKDFCSIVAQIETACTGINFVYLPGDNADHGRPSEYRLVSTVLKMLSVPVYLISGDHDMEQGSLNNLYAGTNGATLPFETRIGEYACFFLDCCGKGKGGPDFRLGREQLQWLQDALAGTAAEVTKLLFMHTYPADLVEESERRLLLEYLDKFNVRLLAMGHTHYNELANDGTTIFCATRSTGQIDEGPVGYSLIAVDDGRVSWRFKQLDDPFPFVLITSPADERLQTRSYDSDGTGTTLRAVVFGQFPLLEVCCRIGSADWTAMQLNQGSHCWEAWIPLSANEEASITVRATDERKRPGFHQISVGASGAVIPNRFKNGSDEDRVMAWPENGIPGTQLGPNRNAKPFPKPVHS